jgi:hypothetical protein
VYLGHAIDGGFFFVDMGDMKMSVPEDLAMVMVLPDQETPLSVEVMEALIHGELSQVLPGLEWQV